MNDFHKLLVDAWVNNLKTGNIPSKTAFCNAYDTSTRTLNRAIDAKISEMIESPNFSVTDIKLHFSNSEDARVDRLYAEIKAVEDHDEPEDSYSDEWDDGWEDDYEEYEDEDEGFMASPEPEEPNYDDLVFTASNRAISLSLGHEKASISNDHQNFSEVFQALKDGDFKTAWKLANVARELEKYISGDIRVEGGVVTYKGVEIHNTMTDRLVSMLEEKEEGVDRFCRFFESLMAVPDERVVEELYDFLKYMDIEINDDGSFYAFKAVRANYTDIHTGKMNNSVGAKPEMPRYMVDDNKYKTCSRGLHFATEQYARSFGRSTSRLMKVKVFPADVVSIPNDYNGQKGRACKYEIVEDLGTIGSSYL